MTGTRELRPLFQNLQGKALLEFHSCSSKNRANGTRRTPLFSNHLPNIRRMHSKLKNCDLLTIYRLDLYLFRIIDKCFGDGFDQLLHVALLPAESSGARL